MSLVKMVIQSYENEKFTAKGSASYTVFLNPESFSHTYSVSYATTEVQGQNGQTAKFKSIGDEQVSFDLQLDGTGAIEGQVIDVDKEIKTLRNVVLDYQGKLHSPFYVQLSWGKLLFNCHLTKFDISYTLFKPDGSPLRAKVSMTFVGFTDAATLAKKADNQSSDLTHHHYVKAGDTLPLLCHRIYGKPDYYIQVARRNDLINFRHLKPGSKLVFPPLV
ncbi:CIS tube protein [Hymenobacter elongatus]|uniref:LysM domain-containing protein n=1 Tax=Hymenobacter elongatus TaxID=877208 RepID=A0A4Z0PGZ1_9BACT|nr:hypothetical protein [Hymenobacter elongatus]TGE14011.1 hypothetical protein E5J99_17990 [Hymenobacter elongatus]